MPTHTNFSVDSGGDLVITIRVQNIIATESEALILGAITERIKDVAKAYVEQETPHIISNIDPQAVANLALAESASLVCKRFIDPNTEV